jgi:hypothetical protein
MPEELLMLRREDKFALSDKTWHSIWQIFTSFTNHNGNYISNVKNFCNISISHNQFNASCADT